MNNKSRILAVVSVIACAFSSASIAHAQDATAPCVLSAAIYRKRARCRLHVEAVSVGQDDAANVPPRETLG